MRYSLITIMKNIATTLKVRRNGASNKRKLTDQIVPNQETFARFQSFRINSHLINYIGISQIRNQIAHWSSVCVCFQYCDSVLKVSMIYISISIVS